MSRSEYYRISKKQDSERNQLENHVINCFKRHKGNYGRIRIRKELLNKGIDISEYRISKILKKNGLVAKSGRTGKPRPPKPTEQQYIEENLIKDKNTKIIVYCRSGNRSATAANTLINLGYTNVYDLGAMSNCFN